MAGLPASTADDGLPSEPVVDLAREREDLRLALAAVRRQAVNGLGAADPPRMALWLNLIRETADAAHGRSATGGAG